MLFLMFEIAGRRFALEAGVIVEVLPLLNVSALGRPMSGVAGVIEYRKRFIPVIDLSAAAVGRPAARLLSTRIIIVRHSGGEGGERLIGLVAECATELVRIEPGEFRPIEIANDDPYAGMIANGPYGFVQRVDIAKLVPSALMRSNLASVA